MASNNGSSCAICGTSAAGERAHAEAVKLDDSDCYHIVGIPRAGGQRAVVKVADGAPPNLIEVDLLVCTGPGGRGMLDTNGKLWVEVHRDCAKCAECGEPRGERDLMLRTPGGRLLHEKCFRCPLCGERGDTPLLWLKQGEGEPPLIAHQRCLHCVLCGDARDLKVAEACDNGHERAVHASCAYAHS